MEFSLKNDGEMPAMASWFPRGTLWAAAWWAVAVVCYVVVSRLWLSLSRNPQELGAFVPSGFLVPVAVFCLYFAQLLGLFLVFFFSLFVFRTPTRLPFHRWILSLTLFFAFPVLAVNGLLVPAHMSGQLLWYFLGALSLMIFIFLFFWHASVSFSSTRSWLLFFLLCLAPVLLILSRMLDPHAATVSVGSTWSGRLFKISNFLFLYQGLFWPWLVPRVKRVRPLLFSLGMTFSLALLFRIWPETFVEYWYLGWHVTLPMSNASLFVYFLSLWGMMYAILSLFETSKRWPIVLGFVLFSQAMLGLSPYREQEILPFLAQIVLLAVSTVFIEADSYPFRRPTFDPEPWIRTFHLQPKPTLSNNLHIWKSETGAIELVLALRRNRLDNFRIRVGEEPDAEPDWIVCPLSQVQLLRSLFPTLPRLSLEGDDAGMHIAIWDRHYFSEDLLDSSQLQELARLLLGEIRLWWGQGLVYESVYTHPSSADQERFCMLLADLARAAGTLPEKEEVGSSPKSNTQ